MRVDICAEEMTDRIEIVEKSTEGGNFIGLRFYLYLPVTNQAMSEVSWEGKLKQIRGPFIPRPSLDPGSLGKSTKDDSAAVTFWGKRDLRKVFVKAIEMLDDHYGI